MGKSGIRSGAFLFALVLVCAGCGFIGETDTSAEPIRGFNGELVEDSTAGENAWTEQVDAAEDPLAFAETEPVAGSGSSEVAPPGRDDWISPEIVFDFVPDDITLRDRNRLALEPASPTTTSPLPACPDPQLFVDATSQSSLAASWEGFAGPTVAISAFGNSFEDDWAQLHAQAFHMTPCLLYTSPSPRDRQKSRMPSSA